MIWVVCVEMGTVMFLRWGGARRCHARMVILGFKFMILNITNGFIVGI